VIDIFIAVFGLVAIALALSETEMVRHAAPWVALPTQPFWLEYFYVDQKWAFLTISIAVTFVWLRAAVRGYLPLCHWMHAWYVVMFWELYDVSRDEEQGSPGS